MQGRSYFLKTCYRTGKEIAHMALKFLQQNEKLQEEVDKFYKSDDEKLTFLDNNNDSIDTIEFVEGEYEEVVSYINELIRNKKYSYNDILIVCNFKNQCEKIKSMLPSSIRYNTRFIK